MEFPNWLFYIVVSIMVLLILFAVFGTGQIKVTVE